MMHAPPAVARQRATSPEARPRLGCLLVAGQVRYQLLLLSRSPVASFVTLVVPLMLLVALDLVTPEMTLQSLRGIRVAQFLTPAMASFAVLNAGFVNTVIGTTLAREQGILKRLRGTPMPAWTYFAGRLGAAIVLTACSVTAVLGAGVVLFHAHLALSARSRPSSDRSLPGSPCRSRWASPPRGSSSQQRRRCRSPTACSYR